MYFPTADRHFHPIPRSARLALLTPSTTLFLLLVGTAGAGCGADDPDQAGPVPGSIDVTLQGASPTQRAEVLPAWDNLVMWQTFDDPDHLVDAAGDAIAHNATVYTSAEVPNDATFIEAPGYPGNRAVSLDNENTPASKWDVAHLRVTPRLHAFGPGDPFDGSTGVTISARVKVNFETVENNQLCYGCGPVYLWDVGVASAPKGRMKMYPLNGGGPWQPYSSSAPEDLLPSEDWVHVAVVIEKGSDDVDGQRGSIRFFKDCRDVTLDPNPPIGTVIDLYDYKPSLGNQTFIGYGGTNPNYAFEGAIDELMVWNKALSPEELAGVCARKLTAVWANDGGDKVTQDELRASTAGPDEVLNRTWDGTTIKLRGARNEVVSFNVVLEAAAVAVDGVVVDLHELKHESQAFTISSTPPVDGDEFFDWTTRDIELFFVRYLPIHGLSIMSYEVVYEEGRVPARFRRPGGSGGWAVRPDHDKNYPEIAVPLELHQDEGGFSIAAGENQSVWADIYVPRDAAPGVYHGSVVISEEGHTTRTIPVELEVYDFALPEVPSSKTMIYYSDANIAQRYHGNPWPGSNTAGDVLTEKIKDRHFQLAHRHKLALIDANSGADVWWDWVGNSAGPYWDRPRDEWIARLDGSLFTAAHGYQGPGVGVGNGVFSIATYGISPWRWFTDVTQEGMTDQQKMWAHSTAWEQWFAQYIEEACDYGVDASCTARVDHVRSTDRFLYLKDEPSAASYPQLNQWASWVNNNPGAGSALQTLVTLPATKHAANVPAVDIVASWFNGGSSPSWDAAVSALQSAEDKRFFLYNGKRPWSGSFATEDDGVSLRALPWIQYKHGIDRWFFWESTYYYSSQFNWSGSMEDLDNPDLTNVFSQAQTFGGHEGAWPYAHAGVGGVNHSNGDGVLFYPGTDRVFSEESYELPGPIAGLRLKQWRRGVQDVDYLTLASAVDGASGAVQEIVLDMLPATLWESDGSGPSWSVDPDVWDQARGCLAEIITDFPNYDGCALRCDNGVLDARETGIDCGGPTCARCGVGDTCAEDGDCLEGASCTGGLCLLMPGVACSMNGECSSHLCTDGACTENICEDGVRNGEETDVDCGGSECSPCAAGKLCTSSGDCAGDGTICKNWWGTRQCALADGGSPCFGWSSCQSQVCTSSLGGTCLAPTCSDNTMNQGETWIDCGGPCEQGCAAGKNCKVDGDCAEGLVCHSWICKAS